MRVTVKDYLNVRIGKPSVNAPTYQYLAPGSELDVDGHLYKGDPYEGINTWLKDEAGNYYWSGGISFEKPKTLSYPWWISDFGIDGMWTKTKGNGVKVFLLDTGIADTADLNTVKIERSSVIDDSGIDNFGHGTMMASIIAGNGTNIQGIASEINLISLKISDSKDFVTESYLKALKHIKTAVNEDGYYVVNSSLTIGTLTVEQQNEITSIINELNSKYNVVFCCAVGNNYHTNPPWPPTFPALLDAVVSVAGFKQLEDKTYYRLSSSNFWNGIKLAAPAEYFHTDTLDAYFERKIEPGSSQACAYATGLAALFLAKASMSSQKFNSQNMLNVITNSTTAKLSPTSNVIDKEKLLNTFFNH